MKKIYIIALHLAYGGVEKAITSMANLFADKYDVEIISVYNMPDSPAFKLDERVKVRYLLEETPNRREWKAAVKAVAPAAIMRESVKAVRILRKKKLAVRQAITEIKSGVIITTRHEDNIALSRYGNAGVYKIAQLHHDHNFENKYVKGIAAHYGNIDVLTMLTPGLAEEARGFLPAGSKTKVVYIPNFLECYPKEARMDAKEKTVIAAGRLASVKGFDRLIRAFAHVHGVHPEWKLKIFGEGIERGRLEGLAAELGLEDCVFLPGVLDSAALEKEMLRASIYAMTSHSEGFGFVLIEAQSCWLPVVAYNVRVGPGLVLRDGVDGFLVPDGDESAFVEKTEELIASFSLRREMAENARLRSLEFSRGKVSDAWFSVIENACPTER